MFAKWFPEQDGPAQPVQSLDVICEVTQTISNPVKRQMRSEFLKKLETQMSEYSLND